MSVNPTIRRRRLAATLRSLRERTGMTLDEVADRLGVARSTLSRIETARSGARPAIVRGLLALYGVLGDEAEALVQVAKEARSRGWWHSYRDVLPEWFEAYVGFEAEASAIQIYQPMVIPGLLQTEEYARAIIGAPWLKVPEAQAEGWVKLRLDRQALLARENPPEYWVVLSEAALLSPVGGAAVHRRQLEHLAAMAARPHVSIQVLPLAAGVIGTEYGPFVILDFATPDDPPVAYVEYLTGSVLLEFPEEIGRYRLVCDHQRAAALPLDESVRRITEVAQGIH